MHVIPSMRVINQTSEDDGKQGGKVKARLVVRGDQDMNEEYTPCDSPTVDRTTVKLLLAVAASMEWSLRSVDISAAFLQGREIDRTIFVQPPPEVAQPGIVWQLKKGLYGLKEAARLWYDELSAELERSGGRKLTGDPACFLFHTNDTFLGFVIVHVDDIIIGGTEDLKTRVMEVVIRRFRVSKDQSDKFVYTGMAIRIDSIGRICLNQNQYLEEMEEVGKDAHEGPEDGLRTIL